MDVITKEVLFLSKDKFDSGCGWPAFSKTAPDAPIKETTDGRYGMIRTEVETETTHLGHVFNDGPAEAGVCATALTAPASNLFPRKKWRKEGTVLGWIVSKLKRLETSDGGIIDIYVSELKEVS